MNKRYKSNGLCFCGWRMTKCPDLSFFCESCLAKYPAIPSPPEKKMEIDDHQTTKELVDIAARNRHHAMKATGHPEFYCIIEEMKALHEKKAADYGLGKDILANCRGSTEFGMAAWIGVAMRMNDKMTRLKSFAQKGSLANESVEDSLLDLANYSILALILYREASKA